MYKVCCVLATAENTSDIAAAYCLIKPTVNDWLRLLLLQKAFGECQAVLLNDYVEWFFFGK